jgi:hypothetical protein
MGISCSARRAKRPERLMHASKLMMIIMHVYGRVGLCPHSCAVRGTGVCKRRGAAEKGIGAC